ncbi:MAG TPA: hypothetical protein VIN07_09955 [Flavipsychrobacter sp.]
MKNQKKGDADESVDMKRGSTTQGGSDFGQGSASLAGDAYEQGSEKSEAANYENEAGKLSEDEPIRDDEETTEGIP